MSVPPQEREPREALEDAVAWLRRSDESKSPSVAQLHARVILARLAAVEAALRERVEAGHNDWCGAVISETPYPCSCGHDRARAALGSEAAPHAREGDTT